MPISHKHKLIFIHIPKNAGTSISQAEGMEFDLGGHHGPIFYQENYPEEWKSYTKFAIIRNPWDRMISIYEYAKMSESYWHSISGRLAPFKDYYLEPHPDYYTIKDLDFKEVLHKIKEGSIELHHPSWGDQYSWIHNEKGELLVDHVFYMDELQTDTTFQKLVTGVPFKNITDKEHNDYRDYYDDEIIEIVRDIYKKDIDIFNFEYGR